MTRHTVRIGFAGAALLAATLLAGCGGSSAAPGSGGSATAPSSAAPSSAPATSAPATSAAPQSSAPQTSAPPSSGKPSKHDVLQGLIKFYETKQGLSKPKATKFANCMVQHTYAKASPKLAEEMKDGDPNPNGMSQSDKNLITKGGLACQSALK